MTKRHIPSKAIFCVKVTVKFNGGLGPLHHFIANCRQNYGCPAICCGPGRNSRYRQVADAHQIVGGGGEGEDMAHPVLVSVPGLPEIPEGLHPAENLLHPLPQGLTDGIPWMTGGPAPAVLGHVGHSIQAWHGLDESPGIVGLVAAHGNAVPAGNALHQPRRRFPFGRGPP
jgi:hypothetical protein